MTNLNSQTTADFWDAYITAVDADKQIHTPASTEGDERVCDYDHMSQQ